uniref:Uncharacterized protein n=1 Tax=Utricularia reniformis TaxID=192314 RepID=A0A1Y0B4A8_9LAMI|nr:hypothetical protein AEK19_MT2009 [Utricularia reniformis]ART32169.1 hypothetical protein AEK19_MT2009 [Utricularia reniformis]
MISDSHVSRNGMRRLKIDFLLWELRKKKSGFARRQDQ